MHVAQLAWIHRTHHHPRTQACVSRGSRLLLLRGAHACMHACMRACACAHPPTW